VDADIRAPVFGRLDVPILIGAFNKLMVRVAARSGDGILGHGLFNDRWWGEVIEPELARGAAWAGRDPSALRRWGWLITAIDDGDPDRAIRDAKLQIAFYLTVRTYDSLVELHGWQGQVEAIRKTFRSDRPDTIADHVTDEMLWAIAAWVTAVRPPRWSRRVIGCLKPSSLRRRASWWGGAARRHTTKPRSRSPQTSPDETVSDLGTAARAGRGRPAPLHVHLHCDPMLPAPQPRCFAPAPARTRHRPATRV